MSASVAGLLAAAVVVGPVRDAAASTGPWGYRYPVGDVAHGAQTLNPVSGLWCLDSVNGCGYNPGMEIVIQAFNGATFSSAGATTDLDVVFGPSSVGTCLIVNPQLVHCGVTASGQTSTVSGDGLIAPGWNTGITLTVPASTANNAPVVHEQWFDTTGMYGSESALDTATLYVNG
jgi:hypothetical protein